MGAKRVVSRELTEVRTVLSRARTALASIDTYAAQRANGYEYALSLAVHTPHELSMMRSALITAIDVLAKAEGIAGRKGAA